MISPDKDLLGNTFYYAQRNTNTKTITKLEDGILWTGTIQKPTFEIVEFELIGLIEPIVHGYFRKDDAEWTLYFKDKTSDKIFDFKDWHLDSVFETKEEAQEALDKLFHN